jgi:rubrerythrin
MDGCDEYNSELSLEALRKARRATRTGLCPACGYDLRGTPGRCPECGHVPANAINVPAGG